MEVVSEKFNQNLKKENELNTIISYKLKGVNYILATELNENIVTELNDLLATENNDYQISEDNLLSVVRTFNTDLFKSVCKQLEINSRENIPSKTKINIKVGVKVENDFEYVDLGYFYTKESVYNADTQSYSILAYDKMYESMILYETETFNITYPITIKDFLIKICQKFGWNYELDNFINYDKVLDKDLFNNLNLTYRDILDNISQVVVGNILFDKNEKLKIKYIEKSTENDSIIDEDNLKNINVEIKEKFGVVNAILITTNDNVTLNNRIDENSIEQNGKTEIKFNDNYILLNNSDDFIDNMFEKINGLEYYIYDIDTNGLLIYEPLDRFSIKINDNKYSTLMLNDEIKINVGISEKCYADKPENNVNDYVSIDKNQNKLNNAVINLDKANAQIVLKVNSNGEITQVSLGADADGGSIFQVKAKNIILEGYTSINDSFKIDNKGSMFVNSNITWERNYTREDVNILQQILVDGTTPTKAQLEYYDANGNGILDINDLLLVQKVVLGTNPSTRIGKLKINSYDGYNTFVIYDETNDKNGVRFGIDGGFIKNLNSENFLISGNPIVESGSNNDGEYVKFYDGTMICRGIVRLTSNEQKTSGGLTYYCADTYINFPFEFSNVDVQKIQMTSEVRHENMNYICNTYAVPQSKTQARISLQTTQKNYERGIMWTAIGKWK